MHRSLASIDAALVVELLTKHVRGGAHHSLSDAERAGWLRTRAEVNHRRIENVF